MDKNSFEKQLLATPSKDKWQRAGPKKRAGVLTALFSVYSKKTVGIGDFGDLRLLLDFCQKTGNSILQLLPMNEVCPTFCPYDVLSSFALEPMYLCLENIPFKDKSRIKSRIAQLKKQFPAGLEYVNYQIKEAKINLLWDIFLKENLCKEKALEKFILNNDYWINDFMLFKVLKKYHNHKAWYEWPEDFRNRDRASLDAFKKTHEKEIIFQAWLQYLCYGQFKEVRRYAASKKVLLKGDLPILVSRDSADVWVHQEFFKLDFASGAPPDMYQARGQRWGMPTYNWEKIRADNYIYLKEKLKSAQEFYDILRIDHIVGLFRIWSIPSNEPEENKGLNGFFDPENKSVWEAHGKDILSVIINNTNMLICGEDLGMIPPECPKTMKELGVCGNDVGRWVKDWQTTHDFLEPKKYRFLSVSMLSTHDTTNFSAWWENEAGTIDEELFIRKCNDRKINYKLARPKLFDLVRSKHGRLRWRDAITSVDILVDTLGKNKEELSDFIEIYQNSYQEKEKLWELLEINGPMREKCDSEIVEEALRLILQSNSIFSIQLIIDWLYLADIFKNDSYKYRINTPGTVLEKNWSLTIPMSLDKLLKHKVCKKIKNLVERSQRI